MTKIILILEQKHVILHEQDMLTELKQAKVKEDVQGEESLSKLENLEELMSTAERFEQNNLDSDSILSDFLDNASFCRT